MTGVGDANGGSVVFSVAPANGVKVLRYLDSELSRTEDYQQFGDFNADTVDREFDRLWLAMQSHALKLGLCVRAPISSASGVLPAPAANNVIGWNEDGTGFKNFAPSDNALLSAALAASSGASLVGYLPSEIGAVATTAHSRLSETLSSANFPSLSAALAASATKPVIDTSTGDQYFRGRIEINQAGNTISNGTALRLDDNLLGGDAVMFISSGGADKEIASTDGVGIHIVVNQTASVPRAWGENVVIVKNSTGANNFTVGNEVSVSNNTAQAAAPLANGCVMGFFASYIYGSNNASAAFASGGASAGANGWNNGLWLDGIATGGTGISLRNAVGAGNAMSVGIDTTSHANNFSVAAIALGNQHNIVGKESGGTIRQLLRIDGSNVVQVGDPNNLTNIPGAVSFSNLANASSASAGGASALPGNPVGYVTIKINTVDRKIPYWA